MIKFKPESLNDTTRRFPRTLQEAFPSSPDWQEKPHAADKVMGYLACFVAGYLLALLTMGW
jgi:hypothetical protein